MPNTTVQRLERIVWNALFHQIHLVQEAHRSNDSSRLDDQLRDMFLYSAKLRDAMRYVAGIYSLQRSPKLLWGNGVVTVIDLLKYAERAVNPDDVRDLARVAEEVSSELRQRGYVLSAQDLTPQEHSLMGSTLAPYYGSWPYRPIMVTDSCTQLRGSGWEAEVEAASPPSAAVIAAAQNSRALKRCYPVFPNHFEPRPDYPVAVSLEPLDAGGNAVRDPQPVNPGTLVPFSRLRFKGLQYARA